MSRFSNTPQANGVAPTATTTESPRTLFVTQDILMATWRAFADGAGRRFESSARWAVPRAMERATIQVVTTVIIPRQRVARGYFEVPHEGTRAMGSVLVDHALVNVAQIHTHPDRWVGHSPWDDTHAFSSRAGALSIVWPHYGACLPALEQWGIHERRATGWHELHGAVRDQRIVLVRSLFDLAGGPHELAETDDDEFGEDRDGRVADAPSRPTPSGTRSSDDKPR